MFLDYIKQRFRVVVIDTEFHFDAAKAYVKTPLCLCMKDLTTGHSRTGKDAQNPRQAQNPNPPKTTQNIFQ